MELELKHLKGYLDHGLLAIDTKTKEIRTVVLDHFTYDTKTIGIHYLLNEERHFVREHLPLLYPLSSLTKEIEHDGERFVPLLKLFPDKCLLGNAINKSEKIELLIEKTEGGLSADYKVEINDICYFRYSTIKGINVGNFFTKRGQYIINNFYLYEKLFEWHFNVHNLPDHLFIDKSTVKV